MKKSKLKKALSLLLAVLMVLSCWVFVVPEKASAVNVSYPVKIRFKINDSSVTGHINVYYFPFRDDGSIDTSNTGLYKNVIGSFGNAGYNSAGTTYDAGPFYITEGFPWKVEIRAQSTTIRFLGFFINDKEVTGMVANNNEGFNIEGPITKHWAYNDNDNLSTGSIAKKTWFLPTQTTITSMSNISPVTIPRVDYTGAPLYYTRTATVYDQYGVQWPVPATYTLSKTTSVNGGAPGDGVTFDVAGSGYPYGARVYVTQDAQKLRPGQTSSTYYLIATSGSLSTYSTINLTHPTYTIKFNDADGSTIQTGNYVYGASVTPPANPSKAPDNQFHYTFQAWDTTDYTFVPGDLTVNPTYTSSIHSFTGNYVNNGDATHSRKCTGCALTGLYTTADKSESCSGTWSGSNTSHSKYCGVCKTTSTHTPDFAEVAQDKYIKSEADCTNAAVYYKSCSICGLKNTTETFIGGDAAGHNYQESKTVPHTCDANGYITYECSECEDTYDEYYLKNADGSYAVDGNGDKIFADPAAHNWADDLSSKDDLTHGKVCSTCKAVWTEEAEHQWTLINTDTAATCTQAGIGDYKCDCGAEKLDAEIPATGHIDTAEHEQQNATCTSIGYTAGIYCNGCDTWISGHEEIKMADHALTATAATDADCEADGNIAYWTCGTCSEVFSDENADNKITVEDTVIHATGHSYSSSVTTEATCISDGVRTYVCANNQAHNYTETIYATGEHTYGNWQWYNSGIEHIRYCSNYANCGTFEKEEHFFFTDMQPAVQNGYHDYKCIKCDARGAVMNNIHKLNGIEECYGDNASYSELNESTHKVTCKCSNTKTEGHNFLGWQGDGNNEDSTGIMTNTCEDCGYIAKTNCSYKVIEETNSTCVSNGHITYKCNDCANGYSEIKELADHTPAEAVREDEVAATCYAEGSYDEVVYCSVEKCGKKLSSTPKTIEKIAHTPAEAVRENEVAATCNTKGSYDKVVYCSLEKCKEELSRETISLPMIDHKDEDGDGDCDDCGSELCKHEATTTTVVEPTCTQHGKVTEICNECERVVKETTIAPTGHKDNNGDGKCDDCSTSVSISKNCGCICHKDSFLMRLIYAILRFFWKIFGITRTCGCAATHY